MEQLNIPINANTRIRGGSCHQRPDRKPSSNSRYSAEQQHAAVTSHTTNCFVAPVAALVPALMTKERLSFASALFCSHSQKHMVYTGTTTDAPGKGSPEAILVLHKAKSQLLLPPKSGLQQCPHQEQLQDGLLS